MHFSRYCKVRQSFQEMQRAPDREGRAPGLLESSGRVDGSVCSAFLCHTELGGESEIFACATILDSPLRCVQNDRMARLCHFVPSSGCRKIGRRESVSVQNRTGVLFCQTGGGRYGTKGAEQFWGSRIGQHSCVVPLEREREARRLEDGDIPPSYRGRVRPFHANERTGDGVTQRVRSRM